MSTCDSNKFHVLPFLFAVASFLYLQPYFVWHIWMPLALSIIVAVLILFYLISIGHLRLNKIDLFVSLFIALFMLFYGRPLFANGMSLEGFLINTTAIVSFILLNSRHKLATFNLFRVAFSFSLLPGLIVWLAYILGVDVRMLSIGLIEGDDVLNVLKADIGQFYYIFPGSVVTNVFIDSEAAFFRFCGMYDEPGVVGTIAGLLLVADKFDIKKKSNAILLFGGIVSLSIAFLLILLIYLTFNQRKYFLHIFVGLLILGAVTIFTDGFSETIYNQVWKRFEIVDGLFVGDNRTNDLTESIWLEWKSSGMGSRLFGLDYDVSGLGSSSWKSIAISKGVLGLLGLVSIFLILLFSYRVNYAAVTFSIVFMASFYQRPHILLLPYIVIFIGGVLNSRIAHNHCGNLSRRFSLRRITSFE